MDEQTYDKDGEIAARGTVNTQLLAELLAHPYFAQQPPKSTGRETFGREYVEKVLLTALHAVQIAPEDLIATATALTAESIAAALRNFILPHGQLDVLILGGGGSYNPTLKRMLSERLPEVPLRTHEDMGISSEAKEAIAFALLGHATLCGVPNNLPAATGASHPVILGKIVPGA